MSNIEVHFSSKSNEWQTPPELFNLLDNEFHFGLDVAATKENARCKAYFTQENNALTQDWAKSNFCNPPYGRLIGKFVKKAYEESIKGNLTCLLIPARVETNYFFNYCSKGEVRFINGRLKFINPSFPSFREDGNFNISSAPFPSCIVIFSKDIAPCVKWVNLDV